MKKFLFPILFFTCIAFNSFSKDGVTHPVMGADRLDVLLPMLENKKVALVINHTSVLSTGTHLLDTLLAEKVHVTKIFAPEHGFRGDNDAGEKVTGGKDAKTGVPIVSLYGRNMKPSASALSGTDIVIFDIQDVGARFYTYISTMHYVMEACAENKKTCIILDRPNPNDHIDGPVLERKHKSFVGMHPIPILHGLTIGELAQMINGEGWLAEGRKCDLAVVTMKGWKHKQSYSLPIKPSPNLPNDQSIKLYPSLCFFEATNVSVGRGTFFPFQVVGYPDRKFGTFSFTPKALEGFDKDPLQKNKICYGIDLRSTRTDGSFTLEYFIGFYKKSGQGSAFFKSTQFMDMLAGTNKLRTQIIQGMSEREIRKTWQEDLKRYKNIRKKYLLYNDSEL